jgi:putative cardiolipin synthase
MEDALALMVAAEQEVLIASPYFVPGPKGIELMRQARARGIDVAVTTNSLGATDEPLAHWGYARYRERMLAMGVHLRELSPTRRGDAKLLGHLRSSLARLHAKVAVVDRRWLLVGSMNMDLRSSRLNTELSLAIDSAALAREASELVRDHWHDGNYRLRLRAHDLRIEWVSDEPDRVVVYNSEPDADWLQRLRLDLMSAFVSERLL